MSNDKEFFVILGGLSISLLLVWLTNHYITHSHVKIPKKKKTRSHRKNNTKKKKQNIIDNKEWVQKMNLKYNIFWIDVLKSPKYMMAPMVLQSELAFRMMCRKYNCKLAWTPMVRASVIISNFQQYGNLNKILLFNKYDRPLIVQLCCNKPNELIEAGKIIKSLNICDAIDINLGCPQRCAMQENFGAFLLDDPITVKSMITKFVKEIPELPITAKIRILPTLKETIEFTNILIESGILLLTVHGRRRERTHHKGAANLHWIRKIKEYYVEKGLTIPIISNGNIRTTQEAKNALKITKCDGVMSACAILRNPYIFDTKRLSYHRYTNGIKMCWEFLRYVEKYGTVFTKSVNDHLMTFLEPYFEGEINRRNWDIRKLFRQHQKVFTMEQWIACIELLEVRLKIKDKMIKTNCDDTSRHNILPLIRKNKIKSRQSKNKLMMNATQPYNKMVNALFGNDNDSD